MSYYTDLGAFLFFPGLFFILYISLQSEWLIRKIGAKFENRIGPPIHQPIYDIGKLLAKERIYAEKSMSSYLYILPRVQLMIAIIMAFFIPIYQTSGLISFEGDLFFFLFLLSLHGITIYYIGWASQNPYTISGSGRALISEISFEIPLALSMAGMAIVTKSMRISQIMVETNRIFYRLITFKSFNYLYVIPYVIFFVITVYCSLGALEYNPFSAPHAETEIVGGWKTELTGSDLATAKLAEIVNIFNVIGIIVTVFLGGTSLINALNLNSFPNFLLLVVSIILFFIKFLVVLFIISFLKTLNSRLRIDQISNILWSYLFPMALIGIVISILILTTGGV